MLLVHAFCLLLVASQALHVSAAKLDWQPNHSNHWIFIHYHKTGHDLARKLGQIFQLRPCRAIVFHSFLRRIPLQNQPRLLQGTDVAIVAAPEVQVPWNASFLNQTNSEVHMVHFVRDPFDMIVSAYLYHSQSTPPGKEAWLKYPTFDPCETDMNQLQHFANILGLPYGSVSLFMHLIEQSLSLCTDMFRRHPSLGANGYSAALRSLTIEDGLLLEAARSILNVKGGDILRMGTNALFEQRTQNNSSYRVFLDDFPVGNVTRFAQSSHKLFTHLMSSRNSSKSHFSDCIDVATAVRRSIDLVYIPDANATDTTLDRSTHVTKNLISSEERKSLKSVLKTHRVFGPILNTVQNILLQHKEN